MADLCDCGTCKAIYADRIRRALSDVYLPEGVDIWMKAAQRRFDGLTALQMIEAGRAGEVFTVAESLSGQIAT